MTLRGLLAAVIVALLIVLVPPSTGSRSTIAPEAQPAPPPLSAPAPPHPLGTPITYRAPADYDELVSWWQSLAAAYPNYVSMFQANTFYGKGQVPSSSAHPAYDLWYVLVTNHSLPLDRPEVYFTGNPHGDEVTGPIGAYWFVHWWLRYALTTDYESAWDPWLNYLLDHREVYFGVSHNPDGWDRNRRGDASGRDLNRETDHDGPEGGSGWPDVFTSVQGQTAVAFLEDHQALTGMDVHGGIRAMLYPWGSTRAGVTANSPVTGRAWGRVPPDFEFYDVFSHRTGDFMGDFGGDLGAANVGPPEGIVGYVAQGTYLDWGYGSDDALNVLEDPFVTYGPYRGSGVFWLTPELSTQKTPPSNTYGGDNVPGWGTDTRRMYLSVIDVAEPYVAWNPSGALPDSVVQEGTVPLAWNVNGSLVADRVQLLWGTDPDPVNNFLTAEPERTNFLGDYVGGTGWDGALDGDLGGYTWQDTVTLAPGEYYFVVRAMVDQRYNETLNDPAYGGTDTYLRLIKQRNWEGWNETITSTLDGGVQTLLGRKWWYSPVMHLTVVGDTTPPIVTLVTPGNNSLIRPGDYLTFAVQESLSYTLKWSVDGGAWLPMVGLVLGTTGWAEGLRTLSINATDARGNTATYVFGFDVDGTPPAVGLISPAAGSVIPPGTLLDFTASDAHLSTVTWGEGGPAVMLPAPYDLDTTTWADGVHALTITATDAVANVGTLPALFTVDSDFPLITLQSPASGAILTAGTPIAISVTDPNLDTVTVDTGSGPTTASPPISIDTTGWPDGDVTIAVAARDAAGHLSTATFPFTIDSTPPVVTAVAPPPYAPAGLVLDFTVTDLHLAAVTSNAFGPFSPLAAPYNLSTTGWYEGPATVWVYATDAAGNTASASVSVVIDSTPPVISLEGGDHQILQSGSSLDVTVIDPNLGSVSFTATDVPGGVLTAPFTLDLTGWPEGDHAVTLTAIDLAGNTGERTYIVSIDDTPPRITADPAGGVRRPGTPISIAIQEIHFASATYAWRGTPVYIMAIATIPTIGLLDGPIILEITAIDLAGNNASSSLAFIFDGNAPVSSVGASVSPSGVVTVTATLLEPNPGPVVLEYSLDGHVWESLNMSKDGGGYYAVLEGLPPGALVRYRVTATDLAGNSVRTPGRSVEIPMPPAAPFPIVSVAIVLLVVVTLILALLLWRRRRRKSGQTVL